jgi:hypothetical protein
MKVKKSVTMLLFFVYNLIFKSAAHSSVSGTGSFTIHTPYKTILFVRLPHDLKLNTLTKLSYEAH